MQDTGRIQIKCQLLFVLADWFWAEIYYYSYERHTQETNWNNAICAHKLYPTRPDAMRMLFVVWKGREKLH